MNSCTTSMRNKLVFGARGRQQERFQRNVMPRCSATLDENYPLSKGAARGAWGLSFLDSESLPDNLLEDFMASVVLPSSPLIRDFLREEHNEPAQTDLPSTCDDCRTHATDGHYLSLHDHRPG